MLQNPHASRIFDAHFSRTRLTGQGSRVGHAHALDVGTDGNAGHFRYARRAQVLWTAPLRLRSTRSR